MIRCAPITRLMQIAHPPTGGMRPLGGLLGPLTIRVGLLPGWMQNLDTRPEPLEQRTSISALSPIGRPRVALENCSNQEPDHRAKSAFHPSVSRH